MNTYFKFKEILLGSMIVAFTSPLFYGCKSKQPIQKVTGSTEVTLPLDGKEYKTDKEHFRARQNGKSPDLATAKKIALMNAKTELASMISTTIKAVTDNYTNQRTVGNKQEFENKFEELAREVVNQKLAQIKVIGEKSFLEPDNSYTYWIVVEASSQEILNETADKISKSQKLQLEFDKQNFEKVYNEEMQKLENGVK